MSVSYYKGAEIPEMNYNITVDAELQEKSIDITENGTTTIIPDSDYNALSSVTVNVNVEGSGGGEGLNLKDIGYDYAVPDLWKEGLEYAKEIQENWDSTSGMLLNHFKDNKKLVFMPMVDTSKKTNLNNCFSGCSSLTTIPELDTSNVTDMSYCFKGCSNLTTIPQLNTGEVTSMNSCFDGCSSLREIPLLNTGKVTNMQYCFSGCSSLTTIPQLDTGEVTSMTYCFYGCKSLTSIPELDTSNVTSMNMYFSGCSNLKRIEGISFKSMGKFSSASNFIFGSSSNIPCRYIFIKDIGTNSSCTTIDATYARVWGINDTDNPDARQSLLDSLLTYSFDRAAAGYSNCTIKLYSFVKALLTEDEIAQIQAKGYVIS